MEKKGSVPNLPIKWSISIGIMLNFDCDGDGDSDVTCKRSLILN